MKKTWNDFKTYVRDKNRVNTMYHAQIQQLLRAGNKVVPREIKWTLFHGYSFISRS